MKKYEATPVAVQDRERVCGASKRDDAEHPRPAESFSACAGCVRARRSLARTGGEAVCRVGTDKLDDIPAVARGATPQLSHLCGDLDTCCVREPGHHGVHVNCRGQRIGRWITDSRRFGSPPMRPWECGCPGSPDLIDARVDYCDKCCTARPAFMIEHAEPQTRPVTLVEAMRLGARGGVSWAVEEERPGVVDNTGEKHYATISRAGQAFLRSRYPECFTSPFATTDPRSKPWAPEED